MFCFRRRKEQAPGIVNYATAVDTANTVKDYSYLFDQKEIWVVFAYFPLFIYSYDLCHSSVKYIYLIATGNHHPFGPGPEHKLPRILPPQYDLLNKHPSVRRVISAYQIVQNLRRHSFNEQSFSILINGEQVFLLEFILKISSSEVFPIFSPKLGEKEGGAITLET